MKKSKLSRRKFLGAAAAGASVFSIVPSHVVGQSPEKSAPGDTINIALIGAGGQGNVNLAALLGQRDVQFVAVADPAEETDYSRFYYRRPGGRKPTIEKINQENDKRAGGKQGKRCAEYIDYREMFDKQKDIDAVVVATPDHVHAVAAMTAIKLGKHVYCEKPMTHSIHEARMLRNAAREAGVATQLGNQGHSGEGFALAVEWVQSGALGTVREVVGWSGAGGFSQPNGARSNDKMEIPKSVNDWDLWIGPAPYREYNSAYHPFNWRGWWDFGNGGLGDMGCHNLDQACAALDLDHPTKIVPEVNWNGKETAPDNEKVTYHFPKKGDREALTVTWYGGKRVEEARPRELEQDRKHGGNGLVIRGDKATIMCAGWAGTPRIIPETAMQEFKRPEKTYPRVKGGHHRSWLDAIKNNSKASGDFEYSARLTEFILLGCLAIRAGQTIEWNGEKMEVTNIREANNIVKPEYRKGWSL